MIVEVGHFALVLALLVAIFQMVVPAYGAQVRDQRLMAVADPAALCQFGLLLVAFLALTIAYVTSDFSVVNVANNSHSTKPASATADTSEPSAATNTPPRAP
jgi:cytochrome c-type biogenesis protein CcmF